MPQTSLCGNRDRFFPRKVLGSIAALCLFKTVKSSLIDHFSAQASCLRTNIDNIIGRPYDVFVVLNNDYGITQLLKASQDLNEQRRVARMEADARSSRYKVSPPDCCPAMWPD